MILNSCRHSESNSLQRQEQGETNLNHPHRLKRLSASATVARAYGLRTVEAQLLNGGFEVLTVDPDNLCYYLNEAEVLGIYVMDSFGLRSSILEGR